MKAISPFAAQRWSPKITVLFGFSQLVSILATFPAFAQCAKATPEGNPVQEKTIPQIYDRLSALGYWNIDRIEYHQKLFEVRANDKHGARMRLSVDSMTGEVTEARRQDRKKERDAERSE